MHACMRACTRARVRACTRACMHTCIRTCVSSLGWTGDAAGDVELGSTPLTSEVVRSEVTSPARAPSAATVKAAVQSASMETGRIAYVLPPLKPPPIDGVEEDVQIRSLEGSFATHTRYWFDQVTRCRLHHARDFLAGPCICTHAHAQHVICTCPCACPCACTRTCKYAHALNGHMVRPSRVHHT